MLPQQICLYSFPPLYFFLFGTPFHVSFCVCFHLDLLLLFNFFIFYFSPVFLTVFFLPYILSPRRLSSPTILHFSPISLSPIPVMVGLLCLHAASGSYLSGALNPVCLSKGTGLTYSAATTSFQFCPKALNGQLPDQLVPSGT